MLLISFDNLEDRQFSATLGRLCFILICGAISLVTVSLKRAGIPLHLDKEGSGDNLINKLLWNLMICIPLVAALASCIGYLATVAGAAGQAGNLRRHLVPAAGDLPHYPPLDADSASPYCL